MGVANFPIKNCVGVGTLLLASAISLVVRLPIVNNYSRRVYVNGVEAFRKASVRDRNSYFPGVRGLLNRFYDRCHSVSYGFRGDLCSSNDGVAAAYRGSVFVKRICGRKRVEFVLRGISPILPRVPRGRPNSSYPRTQESTYSRPFQLRCPLLFSNFLYLGPP